MLEFIDESELELLGLDDVSLPEREVDDELSVLLVPVPVLVLGSALGAALVLGDVDMLGDVEVLGLVLGLLGVLVVSLLGGVVAPGVRVVVVDCVVVELELSVVDCAYTYPAITANAEALPIITDRNRFI